MGKIFNQQSQNNTRKFLRKNLAAPELKLWYFIKNKQFFGYKFRRQFGIGKFIVDFYCPKKKLVIEIDGDTHFNPGSKIDDELREKYLNKFGIKVIRFNNLEIFQNIEGVLGRLRSFLI